MHEVSGGKADGIFKLALAPYKGYTDKVLITIVLRQLIEHINFPRIASDESTPCDHLSLEV